MKEKTNSLWTFGLVFSLLVIMVSCSNSRSGENGRSGNEMGMLSGGKSNTIETITEGIRTGNMETLSRFLAPAFSLSVLDQTYESPTAVEALQTFYTENKPLEFEVRHQGTSKTGDGRYLVGQLRTGNGLFRTNVILKKGQIVELKFSRPTH